MRVGGCGAAERDKRPLDATAALFKQRLTHPEGDRGRGQRNSDWAITVGGKGPIERRAQIVDFRCTVIQPFASRPRRRFAFSQSLADYGREIGQPFVCRPPRSFATCSFEKIAVVLGMMGS